MTSDVPFSLRRGLVAEYPPITVREEAPPWIRNLVLSTAAAAGMSIHDLRKVLCSRLLEAPNPDNWSSGNVEHEVNVLLWDTKWFLVYDFIEGVAVHLRDNHGTDTLEAFSKTMNEGFMRKGVGWQLIGTCVEARGDEVFETSVRTAVSATESAGYKVANKEIHEALLDLSRRPSPDISGSVQHAIAALECVARDVTADHKSTLGDLLKRHPDLFPSPLDVAATKVWGFASERMRHVSEKNPPTLAEAQLLVGLSSVFLTYLIKKLQTCTVLTPFPF